MWKVQADKGGIKHSLGWFGHDLDVAAGLSMAGVKMRRLTLALCAWFVGLAAPVHAESFLCVGQLSTGFRWHDGGWQVERRETSEEIFVVQPSGAADYAVTRVGMRAPEHYCPSLRRGDGSLFLICGGLGNGFVFSARSLRFQRHYGIGFTGGSDSNANAPHMTIGKCVMLELRGSVD